ncbi:MAG: hypothetical protein AAB438_01890, partial [Patescibacteria group bacterium]
MQNKKTSNGGYVAIVLLVLGFVGIGLFAFRTDLFTGNKEDKSMIEQDLAALEKATEAKNLIEESSKKTN